MIGKVYWCRGIILSWIDGQGGRWSATASYYDDGFANDEADHGSISTEGEISTRYFVCDGERVDALTVVIDTVLADSKRLGIVWKEPTLYMRGDGLDADWPPPAEWKKLLRDQAARLGWTPAY